MEGKEDTQKVKKKLRMTGIMMPGSRLHHFSTECDLEHLLSSCNMSSLFLKAIQLLLTSFSSSSHPLYLSFYINVAMLKT